MLPRAKTNEYYEQYKPVPVTFSKEVIGVTGLLAKMVNLKCGSDFFPCVIYSTSFEEAKVVANNKSGLLVRLKETNNVISLRFCFKVPATEEQVAFLVPSRLANSVSYGSAEDMSVFTLQFSQRPPDDLIEIMGRILESNHFYAKLKEKLFVVNPDMVRKTRLVKQEAAVSTGSIVSTCVLRELAFGAARLITKGMPSSILDTSGSIKLEFTEPQETITIEGTFSKFEQAVNHPEVALVTLTFADSVPLSYKAHFCDYINMLRVMPGEKSKQQAAEPVSAELKEEAANVEQSSPVEKQPVS